MRKMQVTIRAMQNPGCDMLAQASERYRAREIPTEYDCRHEEFVASASIELKDGHVYGSSSDEEEQEDGGDRNVDLFGREATK